MAGRETSSIEDTSARPTSANGAQMWGSGRLTDAPISCALVDALLEVSQHVITRTHGERYDRHGGCFIRATRENTCVADVEIGNVVGLRPLVRDVSLGVVTKPADASFMQAGSGTVGFFGPAHNSPPRAQ